MVERKSIIAANEEGTKDVAVTLTAAAPAAFKPETTIFAYDAETKTVYVSAARDEVLGIDLVQDTDYTLGGTLKKINPGNFNVQLLGKGNYKDTFKAPWGIEEIENPATLVYTDEESEGTKAYDGEDITAMLKVELNGLPENKTDITWEYYPAKETKTTGSDELQWVENGKKLEAAPKDAGDYIVKATVTSTGYEDITLVRVIHVEKQAVAVAAVLDKEELTYGEALPKVMDTAYDGLLEAEAEFFGKDFIIWTLDFANSKYTGAMNASEKNKYAKNYAFEIAEAPFTINAKDIESEDITVTYTQEKPLSETGFTECDDIVIKDATTKETLVEGTDYTLNGDFTTSEVGEFTIEITGTGNYTGVREITWKVVAPAEMGVSEIVKAEVYDDQGRIVFTYNNTYEGEAEATYGVLLYRGGELYEDMTVGNTAYTNAEFTIAAGTFRTKDKGDGVNVRPYIKLGNDYIYGEQIFVNYEELKKQKAFDEAVTEITEIAKYDDQGRIVFTYNNTYEGEEEVSYGVLLYRGGELTEDMTVGNDAYTNAEFTIAAGTFRTKDKGDGVNVRSYIKIGEQIKYGEQRFVKYADFTEEPTP